MAAIHRTVSDIPAFSTQKISFSGYKGDSLGHNNSSNNKNNNHINQTQSHQQQRDTTMWSPTNQFNFNHFQNLSNQLNQNQNNDYWLNNRSKTEKAEKPSQLFKANIKFPTSREKSSNKILLSKTNSLNLNLSIATGYDQDHIVSSAQLQRTVRDNSKSRDRVGHNFQAYGTIPQEFRDERSVNNNSNIPRQPKEFQKKEFQGQQTQQQPNKHFLHKNSMINVKARAHKPISRVSSDFYAAQKPVLERKISGPDLSSNTMSQNYQQVDRKINFSTDVSSNPIYEEIPTIGPIVDVSQQPSVEKNQRNFDKNSISNFASVKYLVPSARDSEILLKKHFGFLKIMNQSQVGKIILGFNRTRENLNDSFALKINNLNPKNNNQTFINDTKNQVVIKRVLKKYANPNEISYTQRAFILAPEFTLPVIFCCEDNKYFTSVQPKYGCSLYDFMSRRNQALTLKEAQVVYKQVLVGLEFLQKKKEVRNGTNTQLQNLQTTTKPIFHLDIKEENILIDASTYNIKLIDFGVSRSKPIKNGRIIGSAEFCCPELVLSQSNWTSIYFHDIWSIGVALFSSVTGKIPYKNIYDVISGKEELNWSLLSMSKTRLIDNESCDPFDFQLLHALELKNEFSPIFGNFCRSDSSSSNSNSCKSSSISASCKPNSNSMNLSSRVRFNLVDRNKLFKHLLQVFDGIFTIDYRERLSLEQLLELPFFKRSCDQFFT